MGFGGNNWGDPNSMAWLGMAQALGQAAMPSRMPVPNGAVFGALAGGLMQGAKSGYDMKKEQMQTLLFEAQAAEAKRKAAVLGQVPGMFSNLEKMFGGTGSDLTPTTAAPVTSDTSDPGIVPPAGSGIGGGRGRGGWGPLADPAIKALKEAGASDAYIQAQMAHGLAEGGFNSPWVKSGGGENSFGHWQFNAKGELPAYLAWVQAKGGNPQDTAMQALYTMEVNEQRQPGITKTGNAGAAMDAIASNFERYQGHGPGQRRGFLADAQKAMSGGVLEPRAALPAAPGQLAENALPAVPNFAGIMAGNRGASYAPEAPPELPSAVAAAPADRREEFLAYNRTHPEAPLPWDDFIKYSKPAGAASVAAPGAASGAVPPQLAAILANASRPAPVNTITPLASSAVPVAPLSMARGAPVGAPAMASRGSLLSPQAMALAKAEAMSQLAGLGDIFKPWATAYYNSPAQKAEVEAATTLARETAGFRFVGPKAQAEAAGKTSVTEPSEIRIAREKALLEQQLAEAKSRLDTVRALTEKGQRVNPTTGEIEDIPGAIKTGAAAKGADAKAIAAATAPYERKKQILQAALDENKQKNAADLEPTTIVVTLPDGSQVERQVTKKQYADMVAAGAPVAAVPGQNLVPGGAAPGSPATYGKPVGMGGIPDGYRLITPPEGGPARLERVPGSPGAQAAEQQEGAKQQAADIVELDIKDVLKLSGASTTGFWGALFKGIPGTPAFDARAKLDTIRANVGFDRLQTMRNGSPTGGALGPVSDVENHLLQSTFGNLEQSQSREQFEKNLRRLHAVYQDIVHGAPADLQKAVKEGGLSKVQYDAVMERRKKALDAIEPPAPKSYTSPSGVEWRIK